MSKARTGGEKAPSPAPAAPTPAAALARSTDDDNDSFLPPVVTVLVVFAFTAVGIYFELLGWPWIVFAAAAGARALSPGILVSEGDHEGDSDHEH
jgi:hypothetical protein